MKNVLTLEELEEMNASCLVIERLEKIFGKKAHLKDVVKELHRIRKGSWECWLLSQNPQLTKGMIKNGANVNVRDFYGCSPLADAAYFGQVEIVKLLLKNGATIGKCRALHDAAERGYVEIIKLLLDYGVPYGKNNALCTAASWGRTKVVEFLLENGADVHTDDDNALACAHRCGHVSTAKLLKKYMKKSKNKRKK